MRKSLAALALALTLSTGIAYAQAQIVVTPPAQQALQPAQAPRAIESRSFNAFRANINPSSVVPTTGIYDQGDTVTDPRGFPLGGWSQINLPPS